MRSQEGWGEAVVRLEVRVGAVGIRRGAAILGVVGRVIAAGKSQEAASVKMSGCCRMRSWAPIPDFEKPTSQFCSVPVVARFFSTQGTSSWVRNVSCWRSGLVGLSAYQGSGWRR